MNNFKATALKKASKYLQEKLEEQEKKKGDVYILPKKKASTIHRLLDTLFKE